MKAAHTHTHTLTWTDETVKTLQNTITKCELNNCQFGRCKFINFLVFVKEISVHQVQWMR